MSDRRPCGPISWPTPVRTGDFALKSGRKSKWFIDSKQTVCRPDGILLVAEAMLGVLPPTRPPPSGGSPWGPIRWPSSPPAWPPPGVGPSKPSPSGKETKDHGGGGRIAGALDPGDRVVVTEDTVSRGTSPLEAVVAVREAGAEVVLAVAVVDRGGTAAGILGAEGVPFRALVSGPDLGFDFDGP